MSAGPCHSRGPALRLVMSALFIDNRGNGAVPSDTDSDTNADTNPARKHAASCDKVSG